KFNENKVEYISNKFFYHQELSRIAKSYPNKCALIFENQFFTYKQLDCMSNSLANSLRNLGVKRNDIVPIICDRSYYYIVAAIGVMKSGGAFIYIDPDFPYNRIQYMIKDMKAKIILKYLPNKNNENVLKDGLVMEYDLEHHNYNENTNQVPNVNQWDDLCYLFFTSGTTGKPKVTKIIHDNLIHYCLHTQSVNGKEDVYKDEYNNILGFTKFTFAMTIIEIFHTLLKNKTIVLCNDNEYNDPKGLGKLISQYNIDFIVSTPSRINKYLKDETFRTSINNVKIINFGGENVSINFLKELKANTKAKIYNGYGLSEATAFSAIGIVTENDINVENEVTIGKPACNYEIYILDDDLKPLPIGIEGDIYISGYSISEGYLNLENLNKNKFIYCPFNGRKMYKTGDIGKWTPDGRIVYIGRKDFQVKIHGQRIELEEIENTIKEIKGIDYATVITRVKENLIDKYLIAYYIIKEKLNGKDIRKNLERG
ncbi:acetyl-CoA synthetase-like protein, partial [Piromyces finnis]